AVRRVWYNGALYNEGVVFGGHSWKPFGISYQSMVPKKSQVLNLITPTCISASHVAYGAVRIEWTFMSLGEAAGIAASIAAGSDLPVQDVDYKMLAQKLKANGAVLELPPSMHAIPATMPAFNLRAGLPNFFKKVKDNKKVRVGFIGGSITKADEEYRRQTLQLLKTRFTKASFEQVVAGIAGTDADLGVFRVQDQLIRKKPDLVFIEFAVNGGHAKGVEGIIRKIWEKLPNTDICLIYAVTAAQVRNYTLGEIPEHITVLEKIAQHYGIPSIHLGFHISSLIQAGKMLPVLLKGDHSGLPAFTKDGTHPTAKGGDQYGKTIDQAFSKWVNEKGQHTNLRLKAPYDPDNWQDAVAVSPGDIKDKSGWKPIKIPQSFDYIGKGKWVDTLYATEHTQSYIRFAFEGTELGIFDIGGPEVGQLKIIIDGNSMKFNRFNKYCNNRYRGQYFLTNLTPGRHIVELKVDADMPDKRQILGNNQLTDIDKNPEKYNHRFIYLGKILIRGELR
ncbi:MAG TPA: FAD-dependent oxidoreductase, partial [Arachidicoccus sp.]|nr:FAD-dependent oxidoreductase [Arachidicoccus sp.]